MPELLLHKIVRESVNEVLETMFFVGGFAEPSDAPVENRLAVHLDFEGEPSGALTLRIAASAARSITADFLGEDESTLSSQQIGEVVCEMANMICGSVLSRLEKNSSFRLHSPEMLDGRAAESTVQRTAKGGLEFHAGPLLVELKLEAWECSPAETSAS